MSGVRSAARAPLKKCRLDVFERQLGVFVRRWWSAGRSGGRRLTLPASLATMPVCGSSIDDVDGEQRAERVFVGLGDVDGALAACGRASGVATSTVPILAASGQLWGASRSGSVAAGSGADQADLGLGAGAEAVGGRGVERHPLRQGDGGVLQVGGGEAAVGRGSSPGSSAHSSLWGWCRSKSRPRGAVGEVGGRLGRDRRLELEAVAAVEAGRCRAAFLCGDGRWRCRRCRGFRWSRRGARFPAVRCRRSAG